MAGHKTNLGVKVVGLGIRVSGSGFKHLDVKGMSHGEIQQPLQGADLSEGVGVFRVGVQNVAHRLQHLQLHLRFRCLYQKYLYGV